VLRDSFLVELKNDYQVIMDVMTQKDDLEYLPELTKLKHNLGVERYLDDCE